MARTSNVWKKIGDYVTTNSAAGAGILIKGFNRYINFGTEYGEPGYGLRDNNGTIQFKNENGTWTNLGGDSGGLGEAFEIVSKNLKSYDATFLYTGENLTSITYDLPSGSITKSFTYSGDNLTSIVLSGDTPSGISLTKTITYIGDNIETVVYT